MKKIIQILKGVELSGAESHVYNLSEKLIKLGFSVYIINIFDESYGQPSGRYIERINSISLDGAEINTTKAKNKIDPSTVGEMRSVIDGVDPDIIHTHMPYADLFGGVAARLAGQGPVISTRHHDYLTSWTDWLRFVSYYAVAGLFLDALISVSDQVASQAETYESWSDTDIHVVPHGCQDQRVPQEASRRHVSSALNIPESCTVILSVGRLLDWKGHEYAIRALRHLRDQRNEIRWLIAGDGPERDSLHALARELGVADSLHLLGHRDDVPTLMSAADVLVHPSTSEAFGIVLIEAMMQGTPIVASRAGAIPEIIVDDSTGYLVEPADSKAISDAVNRLLKDPKKRKEMGEAARQSYLRNYTLDDMAQKTIQVYRKVLRDAQA